MELMCLAALSMMEEHDSRHAVCTDIFYSLSNRLVVLKYCEE